MKRALAMLSVLTALCWAVPCAAAHDGDTGLFLDFSGTATSYEELVFSAEPDSDSSFWVYIGVIGLPMWYSAQMHEIEFALRFDEDVLEFVSLAAMPGVYMDSFSGQWTTGRDVGAITDCLQADAPWTPVYFGKIKLFYYGVPGDIEILPTHTGYRGVDVCTGFDHNWCVYSNVGVGKPPLPGESNCITNTPVERASWGTIKVLYR